MKKNIKFFMLLLISILPINVFAYELVCDSATFHYNETFSCKLIGNVTEYDKLSGTITTDDKITCKRSNIASGLSLTASATDTYFDLTGLPETEELMSIKCEVTKNVESTSNSQINISDFQYHEKNSGIDETSEILRSDYIKIDPREETDGDTKPRDTSTPDTRLKTLTIPQLDLTFSQFVTSYNIEVLYEVEKIDLDYTLNNNNSRVNIEGDTNLHVGENIIDIYVTTEDGLRTNCYTLNIKRLARGEEVYYPEKDSSLDSMTVLGYTIKFDKNVYEYHIHLTSDKNSITIKATPTYENATVSISETDNLKNGSVVSVEVTSADESKKTTYKIKITKDAPKKDYTTVILIVLLSIAFIVSTVWFIKSSQRKKSEDPILRLKKDKRKINKGKNFDATAVPETDTNQSLVTNNTEGEPTQNNEVIDTPTEQATQNTNQTNQVAVEETTNAQGNLVEPQVSDANQVSPTENIAVSTEINNQPIANQSENQNINQ